MRVLVLLHDAGLGRGGIAKFNRDLLAGLAANPAIAETVALPRLASAKNGAPVAGITYDRRGAGGLIFYLFLLIRHLLTGPAFDIVLVGHIRLAPLAALLRRRGVRTIGLILHGTEGWEPPPGALAGRYAKAMDFYIAVSALTRDRFTAWSGVDRAKFHILPNSIDTSLFSPGAPDPELAQRYGIAGKRVIMTLARLHPGDRYKGIEEVMACLPELIAETPELVYLVAGDGDDRARLEEVAEHIGVQDHVVFTGYVAETEKVDHYRLADLFVLPGSGEGFGIVLLEALACGVPVIASALDGSREAVLDGKLGAVVDARDQPALTMALRKGLTEPTGAAPDALSTFSEARFRERLDAIIDGAAR